MPYDRWTFNDFVEEIIMFDEICEVPGIDEIRYNLLVEVWKRFPKDCAHNKMKRTENYVFNN
jgi:hypothetical protein